MESLVEMQRTERTTFFSSTETQQVCRRLPTVKGDANYLRPEETIFAERNDNIAKLEKLDCNPATFEDTLLERRDPSWDRDGFNQMELGLGRRHFCTSFQKVRNRTYGPHKVNAIAGLSEQ